MRSYSVTRPVSAGLLITLLAGSATAQMFSTVGYYKVDRAKAKEFTEFMTGPASKGLTQPAMRTVLQMAGPQSVDSPYNFAVVTMSANKPNFDTESTRWETIAQKAGFPNYAAYVAKRESLGKQIRVAMMRVQQRMGTPAPGMYMLSIAQKVDSDYWDQAMAYRRAYAFPDMKAGVANGETAGYMISAPMLPDSVEAGFDLITSYLYKDNDALVARLTRGRRTEEAFRKVHPDKNFNEWIRANSDYVLHVHRVRTRVWKIVGVAGSMPDSTASGN